MADREHLELLASRLLDGDLSPAEREVLEAAMANDPGLREFAAELERVHNSINLLATSRLPADFTDRVLDEIQPPVIRIVWTQVAAAAAVVLTLGVLIGAAALNNTGRPADVDPLAIRLPEGKVEPKANVSGPSASVVAFSSGELELLSQSGREVTNRYEGQLALPAEVAAPANTYAVVEVEGGTAVLSPGARARLSDIDADGMTDFEPIDGDLYLEGGVHSRVGTISLNTEGGVTLRRTGDGYTAEPSHGITRAGTYEVRHRQFVRLYDGLEVADRTDANESGLDDWVISGRADAIKLQLRKLLGPEYDKIAPEHWQEFDRLLRGVLSRPWQRATYAYGLRFLLAYGFLEEPTAEERSAWATIASILAEGTTIDDVPLEWRRMFNQAEEVFAKDPQQLHEFKTMLRKAMESGAEQD
jgi:anti-sigma factor RsiW